MTDSVEFKKDAGVRPLRTHVETRDENNDQTLCWEAIVECGTLDVWHSLDVLREELCKVASCKFALFGDVFLENIWDQVQGIENTRSLLFSILVMGVEKCGEFPDKFFGSSLYSKMKGSMNWSEFARLLSDMCNVSEPFTTGESPGMFCCQPLTRKFMII